MPRLQKNTRKGKLEDAIPNMTVSAENRHAADQAERLREAIDQAGGPKAVADRSGIPYGSIQHYRAGRDMKATAIAALADACGVTIEWLVAGRGPMQASRPEAVPPAPPAFLKLFGTVDMDTMAQALEVATLTFHRKGISPSWRRMAQVVTLVYDTLKEPETDAAVMDRLLSEAENETA